jgi:hypothetical protein
MKKLFTVALFLLLLTATSTRAGDDYGWRVAGATLIGGAIWTVALPITAATKTTGDSYDALVRHPWDLTFHRDLGDYGEN